MTNELWECPECHQRFVYKNAQHSCNDRSLADYLDNKSTQTKLLFHYLIEEYSKIGDFVLHPAKTRIAFAADIRFAYIHRLGRNYVDVVFQFRQSFDDNYCFYKIANIPGTNSYNHYFRLERKEDINDEVRKYMVLAYDIGKRKHLKGHG
jgi:hypothetical protein